MLRFCDNPAVVHPQTDDLATVPGTWWIGHTKARCEKAFAFDLSERGIAYFLPMVERVTFSGGRKRRGMLPLFTSHVFFAGDETTREQALHTNRLCRAVEANDPSRFIAELTTVLRLLIEKAPVEKLLIHVSQLEQCRSMEIAPQLLESIQVLETLGRAS